MSQSANLPSTSPAVAESDTVAAGEVVQLSVVDGQSRSSSSYEGRKGDTDFRELHVDAGLGR